jgi:hypothetical protein
MVRPYVPSSRQYTRKIPGFGRVAHSLGAEVIEIHPWPAAAKSVLNGIALRQVLSDYLRLGKKELATKQLSSVPCPTCGIAAGRRCMLHSGAPRSEPRADRKLFEIEAIETNSRSKKSPLK